MTTDRLHLGFTADERTQSPYARFYKDDLAPLPDHVRDALAVGPQAHELFPSAKRAAKLQQNGYWPVETGYARAPDGAARVFCLTRMPGVTPAMWDWWFAWHGSEAQRYKLWHPRAHVSAAWADGRSDLTTYVGRISNVVEYIGSDRLRLSIRFLKPSEVDLDEAALAANGEVAICARGSITGGPVETGYLIHHVRPVSGGAEMRSRFWIAGENIRARGLSGTAANIASRAAAFAARFTPMAAQDLLVHCAQEMNHLAAILPALHAEFGPKS